MKSGLRRWKLTGSLLCAIGAFTALGCYRYVLLPEDPPSVRRSKIAKRVGVDIITLGFAEIGFAARARRIAAERSAFEEGVAFTHALEAAVTMPQLALLMGGTPVCASAGEEQTCQWDVDTRSYTLFGSTSGGLFFGIFTSYSTFQLVQTGGGFFRLICVLPANGSQRAPGSCSHTTIAGLQREGFWLTCQKHPVFCPPE